MKANNRYNQLGRDNLRRDAVTGPNNWSINSAVLQCWESVLTRCTIKLTREHKRFNKRYEHNQNSLSINVFFFAYFVGLCMYHAYRRIGKTIQRSQCPNSNFHDV